MLDKIYIIPRAGLQVFDPFAKDYLPSTGREVRNSTYWQRRLRDQEVEMTQTPEALKAVQTTLKSNKKGR